MVVLLLARITIQREKEHQLRRALWEMRDAIDRYKIEADVGAFQIKADSQRLPARPRNFSKGS
jgi:general secretion pathway protein G